MDGQETVLPTNIVRLVLQRPLSGLGHFIRSSGLGRHKEVQRQQYHERSLHVQYSTEEAKYVLRTGTFQSHFQNCSVGAAPSRASPSRTFSPNGLVHCLVMQPFYI
jgi:hypothetical protein